MERKILSEALKILKKNEFLIDIAKRLADK